jgi:superoxide reductase
MPLSRDWATPGQGGAQGADDWKKEKHVPVIDCPDAVTKGQMFKVTVTLGKEIAHPNETKHHICWIEAYFKPEGAKLPYQLGRFEFTAHGASVDGPDTSGVYTHHEAPSP